MTTDFGNFGQRRPERPVLHGQLDTNFEQPSTGGGSGPKNFVPHSEVRAVFDQGITLLNERLSVTSRRHQVEATMAKVRLRPEAVAKSHRYPTLFERNRFQVAGVQRTGDILALVTRSSLNGLAELVEGATQRQLAHLSAVAEVSAYEPSVERGDQRSVVTLFDGVLDDNSRLRTLGLEKLNEQGSELKPYGRTRDAYTTSSLPPDETLRDMPWIRQIRPVRRVIPAAGFGQSYPFPPQIGPINQQLPSPIVGVIDTGIDPSNLWLENLVVARERHIPAQYADTSHGTMVASLAATGGGFTGHPNLNPTPLARLLDIQALGSATHPGVDEDDLLILVEDAVQRYGPRSTTRPNDLDEPVIIWNLSLNERNVASEDLFSVFARELDRMSQEHKVLFTISAGNYEDHPLRGWNAGHGPDSVPNDEDRIYPPADAALAVSVGSLSHSNDAPTASPAEHPSPFSRRGPGPGMLVKPDVVHYGGTCGRNGEQVAGIVGPHLNGQVLEKTGTSFAAPQVAALIAELVEVLPEPEPELLKLMLLLSCQNPGDLNLQERQSVNYYGFGLPCSPAALLSCQPWECTVLFRGDIRPGFGLETTFPFPTCLEHHNKRRGFVRMVLAYSPTLDGEKEAEYCQTNVTASLGRVIHRTRPRPGPKYQREIHPVPRNHNVRSLSEKNLIDQGWKWSPAKVYERSFDNMEVNPNEIRWRLSLDLLLRRELEIYRGHIRQPFWLGIRVVDPERKSPVYQDLRQQIQSINLAQPLALRPQISI